MRTSPPVHNPTKKLAIPLASFFPFRAQVSGPATDPMQRYRAGMATPSQPADDESAPAAAAAFFDLDRTLLSGASGPAITAALRTVGLVSDRSIPGQDLIFRVFNVFGENRPSMMLTRQAASLAANWSRARAQEAGELAAEQLVTLVQPYAEVLMGEHRRAGRPLVLATTTPYDLVKPLADRLGFDALVATRYGERDGVYDGSIDGEFVWGHGKYRAVRAWASDHGVDLAVSYAYSDSYYDVPLLNAVGHPHVVNPDPRMRLQALARRWPTRYLDAPAGVPKLAGLEPQQLLMLLVRPELTPFAKIHLSGVEHIPETGPAILCANHRSYFDVSAVAYAVAKRGRPVRFLGKKEVFDAPIVGDLARAMGGIRVERGHGRRRPAPGGPDRAAGRGDGGDHAPGHDPARPRLLRPAAPGPLGRGPAGRAQRRAGHPHGAVGDRAGVAAPGQGARGVEHHRSAPGVHHGGATGRAGATRRRGRHRTDHGRHRGPVAARSPGGPRADRRGAGGGHAVGRQGRSRDRRSRADTPPRHRLTAQPCGKLGIKMCGIRTQRFPVCQRG